jgi:hypothetical protein
MTMEGRLQMNEEPAALQKPEVTGEDWKLKIYKLDKKRSSH